MELVAFIVRPNEIHKHKCDVIGVSVDAESSHFVSKGRPLEKSGVSNLGNPRFTDHTKSISRDYAVHIEGSDLVLLRGTFLIDKDRTVMHQFVNALSLGRIMNELPAFPAPRSHRMERRSQAPGDSLQTGPP